MPVRAWKVLSFAFALAAACGQGSSLPGQGQRARLEGMLDPASLSAAVGQPVQVSVTGTSRTTVTDEAGQFSFDDLAPGDVTLRFHGRAFDSTVRISGLQAGQTMQLTVQITSRGCVVRPAKADEIALVGAVAAVGTSSITVSGLEVDLDASTRIGDRDAPLALADLKIGDVVRVEGSLQAGGKVLAREIERAAGAGLNEVLLRGAVDSVDATAGSFTVSGLKIATDAATKFAGLGSSLTDLKSGDRVLVQGTLQSDGSVKARLVVRKPVAPPARDEVEVEGQITSITAPDRLQVAGKTVVTSSSTRFEGEHDSALTFADLKVGDRVEVEGALQSDGSILAREIEREEDEDHHG